jgi:hypothetical protein
LPGIPPNVRFNVQVKQSSGLCSTAGRYQHFRGTRCLYLQGPNECGEGAVKWARCKEESLSDPYQEGKMKWSQSGQRGTINRNCKDKRWPFDLENSYSM